MAIVEGQLVEVMINSANIKHYESKGYLNLICRKPTYIKAEDLTISTKKDIRFTCDYCDEEYTRDWLIHNRSTKKSSKHSCNKCSKKKMHETKLANNIYKSESFKIQYENSKLKYDDIKQMFDIKNYTLLTEEYIGNKQNLEYICNLHENAGTQITNVTRVRFPHHNCPECRKIEKENENKERIQHLDALLVYKEILDKKRKSFPNYFFNYISEEQLKTILLHFEKKVNEDGIFGARVFSKNTLAKYSLATLDGHFRMYDLANICYPNRYEMWEFNAVTPNFWKDDENVTKAILWFYERLYTDHIISIDEHIIETRNWKTYFRKYGLEGLLNQRFKGFIFDFWNFIFPERWFEWEFQITKKNYWTLQENRISAMKQLLHERLKVNNINEIPNIISYPYLDKNFKKFANKCDVFYRSNIYEWIDECYPNTFTIEQFHDHIASDGTKLDSGIEKKIHEIFISSGFDLLYYENKPASSNIWLNKEFGESYVPDWIINDQYIIEYFGWYNPKSYKNKTIKKYIDKADRKIEYFKNLKNFKFIPMFPSDLDNNYDGMKNKFSQMGLSLKGMEI